MRKHIDNNLTTLHSIKIKESFRLASETQYADTEVEELLTMLRESEHLEEQGDILQYLVDTQGLNYDTGKILKVYYFIYSPIHRSSYDEGLYP